MKLSKLIKKGSLKYTHVYNQTMTSSEYAYHIIEVPVALITLAKKNPDADVVTYGDSTLGIDIDNKPWAVEQYVPVFRKGKTLSEKVWLYISLALGTYIYAGWIED